MYYVNLQIKTADSTWNIFVKIELGDIICFLNISTNFMETAIILDIATEIWNFHIVHSRQVDTDLYSTWIAFFAPYSLHHSSLTVLFFMQTEYT